MNKTLILLSAAALLVTPSLAMAQATPQTVTINGEVDPACTLGSPANATLSLGTMTGADGRLTAALASAAVAVQTEIADAWCNTANTLTLTASPLTLVTVPGYGSPSGFSRTITYNATLTDWSAPVTNRPLTTNAAVPVNTSSAHGAEPLGVQFSALAPLVGGSEVAANAAYIEAGAYSATVRITLAIAP